MRLKWTLVLIAAVVAVLGAAGMALAATDSANAEGPPGETQRYLGIVRDVNGQTIDLATRRGERHVLTDQDTVFKILRRPASLDDVRTGQLLFVRGTPIGGDNVKADLVVIIPWRVLCERFPNVCNVVTDAAAAPAP